MKYEQSHPIQGRGEEAGPKYPAQDRNRSVRKDRSFQGYQEQEMGKHPFISEVPVTGVLSGEEVTLMSLERSQGR
jgi:hypothetical protein